MTEKKTSKLSACALSFLLLCAPAAAVADVVTEPPPDDSCPNGARGSSNHCGELCVPWTCMSDDQCEGGRTCQERGICVVTRDCMSNGGPFTMEEVVGTCNGEPCAEGDCEPQRVCARDDDNESTGCGCRVGPTGAARGAPVILAALAALVVVRRRVR